MSLHTHRPAGWSSGTASCPSRARSCWASPPVRPPHPRAPHRAPSRRTGAGVIHVPVVDQHFVKEDNTPVTGERLLGEPRRERHQEGRRNPWNREDGASQAGGVGPGRRGLCACLGRQPHRFTLPSSGRAPRDTPSESQAVRWAVRRAKLGSGTGTGWEYSCVGLCVYMCETTCATLCVRELRLTENFSEQTDAVLCIIRRGGSG